jgi:adenylyltransferase/sulfurtransferase
VNDACVDQARPFATAGILALSGQALFVVPGRGPCLRCTMVMPPAGVPTTAEQGVLGAVPGILGSLQAMEVIRYLAGVWSAPPDGTGYLHSVDGETMRLRSLRVARRRDCGCASLWEG